MRLGERLRGRRWAAGAGERRTGGGARRRPEGVRTVAVGRIHVGLLFQQKLDELNVATRERVVERRAAAAVLPIVGIGARLHEPRGDAHARILVIGRFALARGHLVQAAIQETLRATCATAREKRTGGEG